ncbi:MAG: hypothetical protein ACI9GW_000699 [Halieaceae bacterium]|jgi:hypothetical protein
MNSWTRFFILVSLVYIAVESREVLADGAVVDKIYHPYVEQLEREVEWRASFEEGIDGVIDARQVHKLGFGSALTEYWFGEIYLIGEKTSAQGFDIEAVEIEARWQLSEQGEYAVDWGLLFEIENEFDEDIWELATKLLVEKEWGRFSHTANVSFIYEWGEDIHNEFETGLALQSRYRYSPYFEPALEFHAGQDTRSLGPAILGSVPLDVGRRLRWEAGLSFALDGESADHTLRLALEYEF